MSNSKDFVIKDGVLTKYKGAGGDVVIPEGVTEIGWRAFHSCDALTSIVIPEGVTEIGDSAFYGCKALTSIVIPEGVTKIGDGTFSWCEALTSIVIPEGVTEIGDSAFYWCRALTSIVIPEGVTEIGWRAFNDCEALTSIVIPDSVKKIGNNAFAGTAWLKNLLEKEQVAYAGQCVVACNPEVTEAVLREGTISVADAAFRYCEKLSKVTIPATVTEIGDSAFNGCKALTSIVIPDKVETIGKLAFGNCESLTSVELLSDKVKLNGKEFDEKVLQIPLEKSFALAKHMTATGFKQYILNSEIWDLLSPEQQLTLFEVHKGKKNYFGVLQRRMTCQQAQAIGELLLARLSEGADSKLYNLAALFMLLFSENLSVELLQKFYAAMDGKKAAAKALKTIADDYDLMTKLKSKSGEDGHPIEALAENCSILDEVRKAAANISYADGSGKCSKTVLAALLSASAEEWRKHKKIISGEMYDREMLGDTSTVQFSSAIYQIAEALDYSELIQYLETLVYATSYRNYLLAYVIFADETSIEAFGREIVKRERSDAKSRYWAENAREALYLSNTNAAMQFFDRYGGLEQYALRRGTTAEVLRINCVYDFGLNKDGKKLYDLGEKTVIASLNADLSIALYDESAGKTVKSMPKRGADPDKHAAATADLSAMKKKIKNLRKTMTAKLFLSFLDGEGQEGTVWKELYLNNPVLRQIASLLVWSQNGKTFVLKDGAAVDNMGQSYAVDDKVSVLVAHPMEMTATERKEWQDYFVAHSLKQPFEQVWEPVVDFTLVKKERYHGIELPAYRFNNQEKHGIKFEFNFAFRDMDISLTDCTLQFDNGTAVRWHKLNLQGSIILGDFKVWKKSHWANHIIGLLDKWTILGRIEKDDATVVDVLDGFTLAQITEFINLAIEGKHTNCTMALMEYKDTHFTDFDPMAEFTLD